MTVTGQRSRADDDAPAAGHGLALAVIATAQLMVVLDATIVNIALPHIQRALGFSNTGLSWVLNAYTLVFGGLLLLGGRMGDLFGRRRMFIIGVVLFAGGSLAGGFAQDQAFLLAMRAIQGVGGAIASPTALALVTNTFAEGPARNRAFGVYSAVSGAGAAIGLILGGVLTSSLSWRWVLFVNAPIGLVLALVAPRVLPESDIRRSGRRLDLPGSITSTLGMAALVYGFIHAATPGDGWANTTTIGSFAAAVVLLGGFVLLESRAAEPLMPLRLFRNQTRVGSYVVMLITGAAVFAMFYFLTQYIQEVKGYSALRAGFAFVPVSFIIVIVAQISSRLMTRVAPRLLIASGSLFAGLGLLYMSQLSPHSSYLTGVLPSIALIAVGMGLIFVPITISAVAGVAPRDSGIASAMINVGQQIGGTIGLSGLVTVFSRGLTSDLRAHGRALGPAAFAHAFTHGADMAFRVGSLLALLGLVSALVLIRVSRAEMAAAGPGAGALPA
jgi:EmrB/QacA subfamily drug resistance transporter